MANSDTTPIRSAGSVAITTNVGNQMKNIILQNALHVPDFRTNLMSVAKLVDKDNFVIFWKRGVVVRDRAGRTQLEGNRNGDLFYLNAQPREANTAEGTPKPIDKWHRRLGHLNANDIKLLHGKGYLENTKEEIGELSPCKTCIAGKMTRLPFPKGAQRTSKPLEIVHSDLCGPMRTRSKGGKLYFATFTDDFSRWTDIYFLRSKDELPATFVEYKTRIEKQTGYNLGTAVRQRDRVL